MTKQLKLTDKQLIDFSLVIAEFMGYAFITQIRDNDQVKGRKIHQAICYSAGGAVIEWIWHHDNVSIEDTLIECQKSVSKKLGYYSDWNKLMLVFEKIELKTGGIEIFQDKCTILYDRKNTMVSIYNWAETKILACFASAYEYCEYLKTKTDG